MNGLNTKVDVNNIPFGSYDCLIGMDWLEKHHFVLNCYNKTIMCLDEEGKQGRIQGIPRDVVVSEIYVDVLVATGGIPSWTMFLRKEDSKKSKEYH